MTNLHLPDGVVFEMLLRLPVQSLLRFRCVCKDWFAQIDSSVFKEKHLSYQIARDDDHLIVMEKGFYWGEHHRNDVVTCYDDYESLPRWKSSYNVNMRYFSRFSTHANGLICLMCPNILLLNPALREVRAIPEGGTRIRRRLVGFGYDDSAKDYIVVRIVRIRESTDHKCFVYYLRTDSWTMVEMPAFMTEAVSYFGDSLCFASSFFSHGSIHWCIQPRHRILTFNTTHKLFQEIEFPHGWDDYYKGPVCTSHVFKVDKSCIALVAECEGVLDVWLMKEYGVRESWTKQYSINSCYSPLCFWKTDKLFLQTEDTKKMVCYDLSKGEVHQHGGQSDCLSYSEPIHVVTCYESLVSIKHQSLK